MKLRLVALSALAAFAAAPALAAEPERVVVTHRLFETNGRFELALLGGASMNNKLTEHYSGWLQGAWNTSDNWAIELSAVGTYARLNGVAQQARDAVFQEPVLIGGATTKVDARADDFADLWEVRWGALAGVRWNPVYGKVSLASELQVHFNFFLVAGAGALGLHKDSVAFCANGPGPSTDTNRRPIDATCSQYLTQDTVKGGASIGAGLRLWIDKKWSLRAEVRDLAFLDSYFVNIDRAQAEQGVDPSTAAQPASSPGVSNVVEFLGGVSMIF